MQKRDGHDNTNANSMTKGSRDLISMGLSRDSDKLRPRDRSGINIHHFTSCKVLFVTKRYDNLIYTQLRVNYSTTELHSVRIFSLANQCGVVEELVCF